MYRQILTELEATQHQRRGMVRVVSTADDEHGERLIPTRCLSLKKTKAAGRETILSRCHAKTKRLAYTIAFLVRTAAAAVITCTIRTENSGGARDERQVCDHDTT